jgi:hypothetical protein
MHDLDSFKTHKAREVVKFMWSFFEQSASLNFFRDTHNVLVLL